MGECMIVASPVGYKASSLVCDLDASVCCNTKQQLGNKALLQVRIAECVASTVGLSDRAWRASLLRKCCTHLRTTPTDMKNACMYSMGCWEGGVDPSFCPLPASEEGSKDKKNDGSDEVMQRACP